MRLSRDKLNKLAHVVADTLAETDECEFLDDRNTIRQEARKALEKVLTEEMKIDAAARQKIASQRRSSLREARSGTSFTASITTMRSGSWALSELAVGASPLCFDIL